MKHPDRPPLTPPLAIQDDNAPLPPARPGSRWTVRRGRSIAFVLVGLAVAVSLLSVYATYQQAESSAAQAAAVEQRLTVLEGGLADRREQRDQERDALWARLGRFADYLCSVLSEQPADQPTFDELRQALGCTEAGTTSPDPPPEQPAPPPVGTPSAQPGGRTVPPAPSAGGPRTAPPPASSPSRPAPTALPPPAAQPSTPPDPRLLDLEPVTDPLCAVLGVCL